MRPRASVWIALCLTLGASSASARPNLAAALDRRWRGLSQDFKPSSWRPFRINVSGMVRHHPWPDTTMGMIFGESAATPFSARYSFIETWEGPRRSARWESTLIRDNQTNKVIGEVRWREKQPTQLITPNGVKAFSGDYSIEAALKAFFEAQPGYVQARRHAVRHTVKVLQWQQNNFDRNGRTVVRGILKRQQGKLLYQPNWADNIFVTSRDDWRVVQTAGLGPGEHTLRLRSGMLIGAAGRVTGMTSRMSLHNYDPLRSLSVVGTVVDKTRLPQLTLVALPSETPPKTTFSMTVELPKGGVQTLKIIRD